MGFSQFLKFGELMWENVAKKAFDSYEQMGRPVLDVVNLIFDRIFDVLLYVTILISAIFLVMTIYTSITRKKEQETDYGYTPFVTVQIPTYNELAAIRCAVACLEFDYPKDKFEILIGDDSNNREVSQKLQNFSKEHETIVKVTKRENNEGYKPGNLNNMLKYSRGEILVIFDSDFIPQRDFLKRVVQPFGKDEKIAAVQAKWSFINTNQNKTALLGATILNVYHYITLPFIKRFGGTPFLCGSAEAIRKDVLIKLGGWDSGNLTEDIEYSIRLVNNGYKIAYPEDLKCDSEVPYSAKDLYNQQMRWAYGVIHSFKKHLWATVNNKITTLLDKICMGIIVSGYCLAFLLLALFCVGFLSLVTHRPEPINFLRFFSEMGRNILLTSGLLIASVVALIRSKNPKSVPSMLASSFSYGIMTTYYVNKGILKAIFGKPMQWYMLSKKGNEAYA